MVVNVCCCCLAMVKDSFRLLMLGWVIPVPPPSSNWSFFVDDWFSSVYSFDDFLVVWGCCRTSVWNLRVFCVSWRPGGDYSLVYDMVWLVSLLLWYLLILKFRSWVFCRFGRSLRNGDATLLISDFLRIKDFLLWHPHENDFLASGLFRSTDVYLALFYCWLFVWFLLVIANVSFEKCCGTGFSFVFLSMYLISWLLSSTKF